MADATLRAVITAEDRASKVLASVGSSLDTVKDRLEGMRPALAKMAAVGTAGLGVIGLLGKKALDAASDYEQSTISFTTMLGSAEKAQKFLNDLVQFAKKTPFELPGLRTAASQLLAYGFEQEKILPNLKALGDIASGVGMEKLPNLILAFGQVKAATKLTGMELRQFTEAGVPLLDELSRQLSKPVAEIQKMVSDGKIGFPEVEKALESLTSAGGRFENMMEKQATSFSGMLSNLNDSIGIFLATQGKPLLEFGKELIIKLQDILGKVAAWVERNPELAKTIFLVVTGILALLAVFGTVGLVLPAIITGVQLLGTAIAFVAANPIVLLIAAIGLIVLSIKKMMDATGGAKEFFRQTWDGIKIIFKEAIDAIIEFFQPLINKIESVKNALSGVASSIGKTVGGAADKVGNLFGRASGGSVSPTRSFIVGENGPELFTPATYGTISNGGGAAITINITGNSFVGREGIAEQISNDIMRAIKRNVQV